MRYIGLMVTPGDGFRSVQVTDTMTVGELVSRENLFGRTISVDGEEVLPGAFATTSLAGAQEVWATGSSKNA